MTVLPVLQFRPLPPPVMTASAPASHVLIFGSIHNNTDAQVRSAFETRFPEGTPIPRHIAVELDPSRLATIACAHRIERIGSPVYAASDPESKRTPDEAYRQASEKPLVGRLSEARQRMIGADMAFGVRLASAPDRRLYLVDRDIRIIRSQLRWGLARFAVGFVGVSVAEPLSRIFPPAERLLEGARSLYEEKREETPLKPSGTMTFSSLEDAENYERVERYNNQLERIGRRYGAQGLYRRLAGERNRFIADQIVKIVRAHPGEDVLLFTGAMHTIGLLDILSAEKGVDVEVTYTDISRL